MRLRLAARTYGGQVVSRQTRGKRLATNIISGEPGSGIVRTNGAASSSSGRIETGTREGRIMAETTFPLACGPGAD
jgi:hypothetical protein